MKKLEKSLKNFLKKENRLVDIFLFGSAIKKKEIPSDIDIIALFRDKDYEKIRLVVEKNKSPVAVWPEKFLLGPYNATLTVSLSDEGPVFKRKIYFFAIPLEYSLGILAIIAIVAFIIVRVRKRIS